jgi:hypothetical protein
MRIWPISSGSWVLAQKAAGLTARQAIHGLGGIGKTRLAIEYAWRQASDCPNALLFVSARSPADFRTNLASYAGICLICLNRRKPNKQYA